MKINRSRWGLRIAAALVVLPGCGLGFSQAAGGATGGSASAASLTFMTQDRSCITGPILKIEPKVLTVQGAQGALVKIPRKDLLQVSQQGAFVFSARSSWTDVQEVHMLQRETFLVRLHNGKVIKDRPLGVTAYSIVYRRFLWLKKRYGKDQIMSVTFLRQKPDSTAFSYFFQEGPAMLFFYPDYYDRLVGLEGKIPVRLYDVLLPEDDTQLRCAQR